MAIFEKKDLKSPQFEKAQLVHDWRNHVPDELKKEWGSLTTRERQIIYFMADEQADKEEWD